jgi:hypothetical protein
MAKGELYNQKEMRRLWGIGGMGLELAGAIVLLGLIGWFIDGKYGTGPWFAVTGAVIGIIGGGYNFLRRAKAMSKAGSAQRKWSPPASPKPAPKGPDEFERLLAEEKARRTQDDDE